MRFGRFSKQQRDVSRPSISEFSFVGAGSKNDCLMCAVLTQTASMIADAPNIQFPDGMGVGRL